MIDDIALDRAAIPAGRGTATTPGKRIVRPLEADAEPTVICVFCGCHLYADPAAPGADVWFHFAPIGGRDANGCRLRCATSSHGPDGWPRGSGGHR